jgi:competence protein ComEA
VAGGVLSQPFFQLFVTHRAKLIFKEHAETTQRNRFTMNKLVALFAALLLAGAVSAAVNINTATKAELEALPDVGPARAQAIIDYRTKNGPFKAAEDLKKVEGVGEKNFEGMKSKVSTSGPTKIDWEVKKESPKADAAKKDAPKADAGKAAAPVAAAATKDAPKKDEAKKEAAPSKDAAPAKKEMTKEEKAAEAKAKKEEAKKKAAEEKAKKADEKKKKAEEAKAKKEADAKAKKEAAAKKDAPKKDDAAKKDAPTKDAAKKDEPKK